MADFWIKIEKGTPDKPEILELAGALGIPDPDTVTGKMIRVWAWFDSNSANGHAPSVTNVLLDRLTGVAGFTDALVTVGWLDKTADGFLIPNFDRHLGKNAKKRALDTERKRKSRTLSPECPAPGVTKKGLDKSRVDKSRVDNKTQETRSSSDDRFDQFWSAYPVKRGKKKALEIWKRKKLNDKADELIQDVINRADNDQDWLNGFIPHATTYFNGERWNDELNRATQQNKKQYANGNGGGSAYEKVLAGIEASKQGGNESVMANDGPAIRPSMDEQLRRGDRSVGSVGGFIEGDFHRYD